MDESAAALELARIHRILNLNGPMQRLETMELKIQSNSMGTPDVMIDPEAADQWRRIAELLAGPDYASLRKVKIDILFYVVVAYDIDIDMPIFNELMTAEMDSCFQNLARSKAGLQLSVDTWVEAVA
ncbi:hypothetical protein D9613_007179 [Agrocybe pediades]|uniref:Uncharacterized protein n=1 Tax=Agrocybe pediades TaxID=84607 RepID=A0A8H4VIQ3_9AGAR|nr:hypothetical protein D9613_007179 [Agrocybe pediades]